MMSEHIPSKTRSSDVPSSDVPSSDVPSSDVPSSDVPSSEQVHPDLASMLRRLPSFTFRRGMLPFFRALMGLTRLKRAPQGVHVTECKAGTTRVRIFTPKDARPTSALLWIHGGGLIIGSPVQDDARCVHFARALGVVVVAPYYRLAPRHPFPAALDDCLAGWQWMLQELQLGDAAIFVLGGESAGGGLAASLAQRLRDEGKPQPKAQLLIYPMLDDRTAAHRKLDARNHPVWNNTSNLLGWSSYLGAEPGAVSTPAYAVPARHEVLAGLAPTWIGVGTLDLFLDECRAYAHRLVEAGVACELNEVGGAFHGFATVAARTEVAKDFTRAQLVFLRTVFAGEVAK